ncbi:MAG: AAA family ATPase [Alphaproteobacteria bacterium]|nr:AAA family ATPase [Alphaproteobacteria bacterium]
MLIKLAVSGYRSLRDIVLPLDRLNLITGANGAGKSSLYKAISLLAAAAQGRAVSALALEGGLDSTLWAGPESISRAMKSGEVAIQGLVRKNPVSLKLGFASEDFGYAIDLGLPLPDQRSMFTHDPEIKTEVVWAGETLRPGNTLTLRKGPSVTAVAGRGKKKFVSTNLAPFESMMLHAANPSDTPELLELRERMRAWRFYDNLRTDRGAPARAAQVGTRTPVLADDGADLAAALQTILEIGDAQGLGEAIDDAFPGSRVDVHAHDALFEVSLSQIGLLRPLRAAELSDGTLRYMLLVAALLTPRPPSLMVLNEPETSLHTDLLAPLARLIVRASTRSQIIVVTHARLLVDSLQQEGAKRFVLKKQLGETVIEEAEYVRWEWLSR